jgi:CHAD domain-containing protein
MSVDLRGRGQAFPRMRVEEFVVPAGVDVGELCGLMPAGLRAVQPRRTRLRRRWLDTADHRLARQGCTLLHILDDGRPQLVLRCADTTITAPAQPAPPRWPADVPPSIAERIGDWIGPRALLPLDERDSTAGVLRVLDDDDKTVARLWLEKCGQERTVRVDPLRGYDRQAALVRKALRADTRLRPHAPSNPVIAALPTPAPLDRQMPARQAVAAALAHLFDIVVANIDGAVDGVDTEFVHDLRVATRRSRSVAKLAGEILPTRFPMRFGPRLRWLGELTTPARDLDVLLLELPSLQAAHHAGSMGDLEPLRVEVVAQTERAYAALGAGLRSARFRQFADAYRRELANIENLPSKPPLAGEACDAWAAAAMAKVLRRGAAITTASAPEALHDLRKRCKELRYCLEVFGDVWEKKGLNRFVAELKSLQENLGDFQDSEIQSQTLRRWAEQMSEAGRAPASTVLAIGRITVHLDARQARARAEFADRFARFSRPSNRRVFTAMTGARL